MKEPDFVVQGSSISSSKSRLLEKYFVLEKYLHQCDIYLQQYSLIYKVSEFLRIRPCSIPFIGAIFISLLFGFFDSVITNAVGFFYPAWQSFKAIENPKKNDDKQWLTYWVVYAFFSFVEPIGGFFFFWIPYFYILKISFLLWLFLPQFHGATLIYANLIRPLLLHYEGQIDQTLSRVAETAVQVATSIQSTNDNKQSGTVFF